LYLSNECFACLTIIMQNNCDTKSPLKTNTRPL
jgi:hypothetical protein